LGEKMVELVESQKRAILTGDNLVLRAAAGSGKTTVLVMRFLRLLIHQLGKRQHRSISEILSCLVAITFTEKAAAEMRSRIRQELRPAIVEAFPAENAGRMWRELRDSMSSCSISTIHSFCASLLRQFPVEAGVDPEFEVIDDVEAALLRREVVESFLSGRAAESDVAEQLEVLLSSYPFAAVCDVVCGLIERIDEVESHLERYAEQSPEEIVKTVEAALSDAGLLAEGTRGQASEYDPLVEARVLRSLSVVALASYKECQQRKEALSVLDFDDLERRVSELLERGDGRVLEKLRRRVSSLLIDEFQDTNRFQWWLARQLCSGDDGSLVGGKLFIVGDERQSIYAFRGADLAAFEEATSHVVGSAFGSRLEIRENFRSLPNITAFINRVFEGKSGVAGWSQAGLVCARDGSGRAGSVELLFPRVEGRKKDRVRAEAEMAARRIASMVRSEGELGKEVYDQSERLWRGCRYEDIAILLLRRTHLIAYQEALRRNGIPFYVAGGLGFYQRQEVMDIQLLVRFLADSRNDLALAGVLRSPLFSVSDEGLAWLASIWGSGLWDVLGRLDKEGPEAVRPWSEPEPDPLDLENMLLARQLLCEARRVARVSGPARAVRMVLKNTGAIAAYASQPDGRQAVANLEKLEGLLRSWERAGHSSLEAVVRRWDRLTAQGVREGESQLSLEGIEGVRVMTVHAAKGLEFPVVFVMDVFCGVQWGKRENVQIDARLGLGVKVPRLARGSGLVDTLARRAIINSVKRRAEEEQRRLWYVACTRARDHLVLCGGEDTAGQLGRWVVQLLGIEFDSLEEAPASFQLEGLSEPVRLFWEPGQLEPGQAAKRRTDALIGRAYELARNAKPSELLAGERPDPFFEFLNPLPPPAAPTHIAPAHLQAYACCPRRYLLEHLWAVPGHLVHPGGQAGASGREFGTLVHRALEALKLDDASLDESVVSSVCGGSDRAELREEVLEAVRRFRASELASQLGRARWKRREVEFALKREGCVISGKIDALFKDEVGRLHIVDYKTDEATDQIASRYRAQMLAYAVATASLLKVGLASLVVQIYAARSGVLFDVDVDEAGARWVWDVIERLGRALRDVRQGRLLQRFDENPDACRDCSFQTRILCRRISQAKRA